MGGPYLDKATLVRVAADVADRDGWANLTLSQVAKEVNRHVTSLYAHVESLDALRREVALLALEELADEVWQAALGRSGEDALAAIAAVERAYCRKHPGRSTAMFTFAFSRSDDKELRTRGLRLAEPLRATFRSFGLTEDQVTMAHSVFSSALRGLVLAEITDTFAFGDLDRTHEQLIQLFVVALSSGSWPAEGSH
jgi:AcrR family transcriptional regulator